MEFAIRVASETCRRAGGRATDRAEMAGAACEVALRRLLPSARMTARTARRRLAFALVGLMAFAGASAPALAGISSFYRTLSLGDRGTDVATIQQLIREYQTTDPPPAGGRTVIVRGIDPLVVPIDGIFGATTVGGVRAIQASRGLAETGIVVAATWEALVIPIGPGATGDAVLRAAAAPREGGGPRFRPMASTGP